MRRAAIDAHGWLQEYTGTLDSERRAAIVADTTRAVLSGVPELADPDLHSDLADLAAECLRSLRAIAVLPPGTWLEPGLPVAGMEFARTLARRGIDVAMLFKVFRIGQTSFWSSVMQVAEAEIDDAGLRMRVLDLMWERLSRWLDVLMDRLVGVHQDERERWIRGALARRTELVGAILAGEDVAIDGAQAILGHKLHEHQTAFTVRVVDREVHGSTLALLEGVATDLALAVGAGRAFTMPSGANGLWGWLATPSAVDRTALKGFLTGHSTVRIAVGRSGPGLAGFRRSHREAVAAQRSAATARVAGGLTLYEDVELVSLLSADPEGMRAFMSAELGRLAHPEPGYDRLRETALAFLQCNENATATAQTLRVHRNTVRNRIARVETMLGRPLDAAGVGLELALMLAGQIDRAQPGSPPPARR